MPNECIAIHAVGWSPNEKAWNARISRHFPRKTWTANRAKKPLKKKRMDDWSTGSTGSPLLLRSRTFSEIAVFFFFAILLMHYWLTYNFPQHTPPLQENRRVSWNPALFRGGKPNGFSALKARVHKGASSLDPFDKVEGLYFDFQFRGPPEGPTVTWENRDPKDWLI